MLLSGINASKRSKRGVAGGSRCESSRRQASSTFNIDFPCANPAMTIELPFMSGKHIFRTDFILVIKTSVHIPSFRKNAGNVKGWLNLLNMKTGDRKCHLSGYPGPT
jgi:hypothetical protein